MGVVREKPGKVSSNPLSLFRTRFFIGLFCTHLDFKYFDWILRT